MRRDSNDPQWIEVKELVNQRDKGRDRFMGVLTYYEAIKFSKLNEGLSQLFNTRDPAHVLAVSVHPSLCYCVDNIITLNRLVHDRMDDCQHPITGKSFSSRERDEWWKRLLGPEQFERLCKNHEAALYFSEL